MLKVLKSHRLKAGIADLVSVQPSQLETLGSRRDGWRGCFVFPQIFVARAFNTCKTELWERERIKECTICYQLYWADGTSYIKSFSYLLMFGSTNSKKSKEFVLKAYICICITIFYSIFQYFLVPHSTTTRQNISPLLMSLWSYYTSFWSPNCDFF